jgi:tetratricopeptide (TPR) repeat protein
MARSGIILLHDSIHTIRIDAARAMVEARDQLGEADRKALDAGLVAWERAQRLNDDRADARTTLAGFYVVTGRIPEAELELDAAIRLDPLYGPAYVNLADLYRATGRDGEALRLLREGVTRLPEDAALHHTLGLTLVRGRDLLGAVAELTRAAELAPGNARFAYVLAVALHDTGERGEAQRIVDAALRRHPFDRDLLEFRNSIRINP